VGWRAAEYIASFVNQIDGPVLLVGHSYGGAVISVAVASIPTPSVWSTSRPRPR
jgi:pimeloyl-ACP methyl ester carboxylesterase